MDSDNFVLKFKLKVHGMLPPAPALLFANRFQIRQWADCGLKSALI